LDASAAMSSSLEPVQFEVSVVSVCSTQCIGVRGTRSVIRPVSTPSSVNTTRSGLHSMTAVCYALESKAALADAWSLPCRAPWWCTKPLTAGDTRFRSGKSISGSRVAGSIPQEKIHDEQNVSRRANAKQIPADPLAEFGSNFSRKQQCQPACGDRASGCQDRQLQ
jgi:hypothetical protein